VLPRGSRSGDRVRRIGVLTGAYEVGLRPDIILTSTAPASAALKLETLVIPMGPGRQRVRCEPLPPGGNVTDFIHTEARAAARR